jgi:hypothetical protein
MSAKKTTPMPFSIMVGSRIVGMPYKSCTITDVTSETLGKEFKNKVLEQIPESQHGQIVFYKPRRKEVIVLNDTLTLMAQNIIGDDKSEVKYEKEVAAQIRQQWYVALPPVTGEFSVTILSLTGKRFQISDLTNKTTVAELKTRIQDVEGLPLNEQRLIVHGAEMSDPNLLVTEGVREGDMIHLVLRLRGDIGIWTDSSGGNELIMDTRKTPTDIAEMIHSRYGKLFNEAARNPIPIHVQHNVISTEQCKTLIQCIEKAWDGSSQDFKLNLTENELLLVVGIDVDNMRKIFRGSSSNNNHSTFNEIKLRRLSGQHHVIDYHLDVSRRTMQVALNDNFIGGELIFIVNSHDSNKNEMEFYIPKRPAGTCTIHDNTHVHGVNEVKEGIRYGLFFLAV